jgi:hypothetical protein
MDLYLNESRGRLHFKDLLGQANHLIVTALVGLDGVEKGLVSSPPPELHAAWSPKSPVNSARRARRLILDMVLVRAVDSVDIYVRMARRLPGLVQAEALRDSIDAAGRSVMRKVSALEELYGAIEPVSFALVLVMIAWRNKSAHEESDTKISDHHRETLLQNAKIIAPNYRGLDVDRLLNGFDNGDPTFKECASLISAAQRFIQMLETSLFRDLDAEQYLKELIWKAPSGLNSDEARLFRKQRIKSIWGRDASDRTRAVIRHLREYGIADVRRHEGAIFPSALIDYLCKLTPSEVHAWAQPAP